MNILALPVRSRFCSVVLDSTTQKCHLLKRVEVVDLGGFCSHKFVYSAEWYFVGSLQAIDLKRFDFEGLRATTWGRTRCSQMLCANISIALETRFQTRKSPRSPFRANFRVADYTEAWARV